MLTWRCVCACPCELQAGAHEVGCSAVWRQQEAGRWPHPGLHLLRSQAASPRGMVILPIQPSLTHSNPLRSQAAGLRAARRQRRRSGAYTPTKHTHMPPQPQPPQPQPQQQHVRRSFGAAGEGPLLGASHRKRDIEAAAFEGRWGALLAAL